MAAKLSEREKRLRGTTQRCRVRGPRALSVIESDLREARKVIEDLQFNLATARKCVRDEGCLVETTVTNSHGHFEKVRRLNPAFKVQHDAVKLLKSFNRQLQLLTDERELALVERQKSKEKRTNEEFSV